MKHINTCSSSVFFVHLYCLPIVVMTKVTVLVLYENGIQTRIDEFESGNNYQSESYFIDEDNYSLCQFSAGHGPRGF